MAITYLIDTNIFLEILLEQDKKEECKNFLKTEINNFYISDFSLHSIGVILFRMKKEDIFLKFLDDIIAQTTIITLSSDLYKNLPKTRKLMALDFDDLYQYEVAKEYNVKIVTLDEDFKKVSSDTEVIYL